jgi:hypothetical protein
MENSYPILHSTQTTVSEFIQFWLAYYEYPLEKLYNTRIGLQQFTKTDIEKLFEWKNGMELSERKKKSLKDNVTDKLDLINSYKQQKEFDIDEFKKIFKSMSAVWKIFLLHLIKPDYYPIYDQHIHRAYLYIHQQDYTQLKNTISNKAKEDFYFANYLNFVHNIDGFSLKQIDEALFSFGRFLNGSYGRMVK